MDDVEGELHHDVALRVLVVSDLVTELRTQFRIDERDGAVDRERMSSDVAGVVSEGAQRERVLVYVRALRIIASMKSPDLT